MKKINIILLILCIIISLHLCGCTNSVQQHPDASKFVGTWKGTNSGYVTFESDGTYIWGSIKAGSYILKNDRIEITVSGDGESITTVYEYEFSNNNNTLVLTPPGTQHGETYTRQ